MDLKIPWKALSKQDAPTSKWGAFSLKQIAFFAVVGLAVIAGIVLRFGQFFGQSEAEQNAPATVAAPAPPPPVAATPPAAAPTPPTAAPTPPVQTTESQAKTPPPAQEPATPNELAGQPGEAAQQADQASQPVDDAGQSGTLGSGTILVSRQPVAMLASPSSSAPTLYGFPAGRPFRVIGHNGGFAQIKDLRSGATGWINEAALVPPPASPAVSAPSQSRPVAASGRPAAPSAAPASKPTKKDTQVTASPGDSSDAVEAPKRPGLFGRGGLFGGIFGGGNGNAN